MPKFSYGEETLREYASYDEKANVDVEAEIAKMTREPNGELSNYQPAQCALSEDKLSDMSRLVLQELRDLGVTRIFVNYNGGGDEGFAELDGVQTPTAYLRLSRLSEKLQQRPLGDTPPPVAPGTSRYHVHIPLERTRVEWTKFRIERLADELASQLLGRGYGTGEYSLEGAFIANLEQNTLTDIAPTERS